MCIQGLKAPPSLIICIYSRAWYWRQTGGLWKWDTPLKSIFKQKFNSTAHSLLRVFIHWNAVVREIFLQSHTLDNPNIIVALFRLPLMGTLQTDFELDVDYFQNYFRNNHFCGTNCCCCCCFTSHSSGWSWCDYATTKDRCCQHFPPRTKKPPQSSKLFN